MKGKLLTKSIVQRCICCNISNLKPKHRYCCLNIQTYAENQAIQYPKVLLFNQCASSGCDYANGGIFPAYSS